MEKDILFGFYFLTLQNGHKIYFSSFYFLLWRLETWFLNQFAKRWTIQIIIWHLGLYLSEKNWYYDIHNNPIKIIPVNVTDEVLFIYFHLLSGCLLINLAPCILLQVIQTLRFSLVDVLFLSDTVLRLQQILLSSVPGVASFQRWRLLFLKSLLKFL